MSTSTEIKAADIVRAHLEDCFASRSIPAKIDTRSSFAGITVRVRIVSDSFQGKSVDERDAIVEPMLAELDDNIANKIVMVLMATQDQLNGMDDDDFQIRSMNHFFETQSSAI